MTTSRRITSAGLVALLTASTAFAQNGVSRGQTPPTPPPADPPVVSIPLGPNDVTEYVVPTNVVRSGGTEQELVRAVAQASGCRVGWLSKSQSLMLTGTPQQLELAKSTLAKLTEGAQVASDRLAAERKAQIEAENVRAEAKAKSDLASKALFDVDFLGGSVRDYLVTLAEQASFTGLVIQDAASLERMPMPAVTLRATDLRTAVELVRKIQYAPDEKGRERDIDIEWVGKAAQSGSQYSPSEFETLLRSACVVRYNAYVPSRGGRPTTPPPPLERAALDLASLKSGGDASVQAILDAITLAIEIDGPSESFVAKFHEPSHLLIVRGTGPEIAIVREIVDTFSTRIKGGQRQVGTAEVSAAENRLREIGTILSAGKVDDAERKKLKSEHEQLLDRIRALRTSN